MSDDADLVGFIIAEQDGAYIYGCDEHAPADKREGHLEVLRGEAIDSGACCGNCGLELGEVEGIDA